MVRHVIWVTFILAVQLSSVLGRNNFYEYYYSRYHHKSHSTTTPLSSSTQGFSTEVKPQPSVSDDDSLESAEQSLTVDFEQTRHRNKTVHSYGYADREIGESSKWIILGIVFFLFSIMAIILCYWCFTKRCRRERKGIVLSNNASEATGLLPGQNLSNQGILPNCPQEQPLQYPGYYQSGPQLPPYYSPAQTLYQQTGPVSQMETGSVPNIPPPPYDAPLYEAAAFKN